MCDRQRVEHDPLPFAFPLWRLDERGFLRTPSGAKAARLDSGVLMLYDKVEHVEVPFTLADWWALIKESLKGESHEPDCFASPNYGNQDRRS